MSYLTLEIYVVEELLLPALLSHFEAKVNNKTATFCQPVIHNL